MDFLGNPRTNGAEGNRTPDLLNAIQALSQLSYGPNRTDDLKVRKTSGPYFKKRRAGLTGLEPATSGVTDRHSNQLSYNPRYCNFKTYALTGNRTPVSTLKEWRPDR